MEINSSNSATETAVSGFAHDIFVSFRRNDNSAAEDFRRELAQTLSQRLWREVSIWGDQELAPGSDWSIESLDEARRSAVFVALITPGWTESNYCQAELAAFRATHPQGFLFPVFLSPVPEVPLEFEEIVSIRFFEEQKGGEARVLEGKARRREMERLSEAIARRLTDPVSPATISRDQLKRLELEEIGRVEDDYASLIPDDIGPFLALAPYIPLELSSQIPLKSFDELVARGILRTGSGPAAWSGPVFWMDPPVGQSFLALLRSRKPREFPTLMMTSLSNGGSVLLKAGHERLDADPTLKRWSRLAEASIGPVQFNELLRSEVDQALRQSQQARVLWSPEARGWIEASTPIAAALEGGYQAAVGAAKRRLELFHRRAYDRARLRNYVPIAELDKAFVDILADEDHWALHFLGSGGVGKTMLIRHLSLDLAESRGAAVSRIDFDYLNPQYPERDPVLLLKALAEEFRLDESGDTLRSFGDFDYAAEEVYRRLETAARSGEPVRLSLQDEDVMRAVRAFTEALAYLSHSSQPILILDTCEELAKAQPGEGVPLNVAHTLNLLKAIHDMYRDFHPQGPGLRVIFSGRRLLPPLPHLRVQIVHGFSAEDARTFLDRYRTEDQRPLKPAIIEAILRITAADGYSPYDLDTYAAWATVDETLTEQKLISEGPLLYVRERIVDRLQGQVRRVFPALVMLGRFDSEMIRRLMGSGKDTGEELSEVLAQEWVLSDSAGTDETWRLDDLFRQRVLRYYKSEGAAARREARDQLARLLPELTRTRRFKDLTPQCFATCLTVLSDTPAQAAAWWEEMERRIAAEAEWKWADVLLRHLEPEPDDPGPMTAAIFATKAAVLLHTGGDPTPAWKVVEKMAGFHPTAAGAQRLRWRAACGLGLPDPFGIPKDWNDQDAASLLAATERYSQGERGSFLEGIQWANSRRSLIQSPDLMAFLDLLAAVGGVAWDSNKFRPFDQALTFSTDSFDPRQVWLDWIRPDNLPHRILLEFLRISPEEFPGSHLALAETVFTEPLLSVDSDRMASAWLTKCLQSQTWRALELGSKFQSLYASSVVLIAEAPTCQAHREYPPLAILLLKARGLSGEAEWARSEIKSLSSRDLPSDVKGMLDEVMLRLVVRMRLTSEGEPIPPAVADSNLAQIALAFLNPNAAVPGQFVSDHIMGQAELMYLRGDTPFGSDTDWLHNSERGDMEILEFNMLQALSSGRSGKAEDARAQALRVETQFEQLTAGQPGVPAWSEILAASEADPAPLLDGMGAKPNVWRPWVVRILACLTPPPRAALAQWISAHDVVVEGDTRNAATELVFVLKDAPKDPSETGNSWTRAFYLVLGFVFIIGTLGLVIWAAFVGYSKATSSMGFSPSLKGRISSFITVVAIVFTVVSRARSSMVFMRNLYSRIFSISAVIEMNGVPADLNRPQSTEITWSQESRILDIVYATHIQHLPATANEAYADILHEYAPDSGKSSVIRAMKWLWHKFPELVLSVQLTVDAQSAGGPWEALFAPNNLVILRRITREHRGSRLAPWSAPMEVVTWGGNSYNITRRDWGVNFIAKALSSPEQYGQPNDKAGVLRILGVPAETPSGLVLQMKRRPDQTYSETYTVRGGDLLLRYPWLRLCILQCPPAELARRLSNDRRVAAMLKRIAAEVFSSGVPIVIALPVLSDRVSDALIDKIYAILGDRPANAVPKLEAVLSEFRAQPLSAISSDEATAREVLSDLCFYAAAEVNFKTETLETETLERSGK
jgi:hypothetical protein